jgi:selenocysteine lyase/cysteine desulfurase
MITKIARKEFTEMWRDGRFRAAAAIVKGDAIRVTPALYTREPDLNRLVNALQEISVTRI